MRTGCRLRRGAVGGRFRPWNNSYNAGLEPLLAMEATLASASALLGLELRAEADDARHRHAPGMAQADLPPDDPEASRPLGTSAGDHQRRLPRWPPDDLDVPPILVQTAIEELLAKDDDISIVTSGGRQIIKRSRL